MSILKPRPKRERGFTFLQDACAADQLQPVDGW